MMISATFLASFTLALAPQSTSFPAAVPAQIQATTCLSLRLEATRFRAQSFSDAPILLVLGSQHGSLRNAFWLAPGAIYVEDFARGTLDSLQLEVLSCAPGNWSQSGGLYLGDFLMRGAKQLWVQDCGHVLTRCNESAPLFAASTGASLLPPALSAALAGSLRHQQSQANGQGLHNINALHVPVPTPSDLPKSDKPPRKRRRQLPPV